MERRAVIGVFRQLFRHLLHPVLAQRVDPGGNGLAAGGGIVHLAGAHQRDLGGVPARGPGRLGDLRPNGLNVFCDRHQQTFLSLYPA